MKIKIQGCSLGIVAIWALSSIAMAAPYRPASPDDVLLTLSNIETQTSRASSLARNMNSQSDPVAAVKIARDFVDLGRSQNDERYFGYASAALEPWSQVASPPLEVAILFADIAQHQHRFIDARKILDEVIARDATHAHARIMHAAVLMTLGLPKLAQPDCQQLFTVKESFIAMMCSAQVASLTGRLGAGYGVVTTLLQSFASDTSDAYGWGLGIAGEMADRKGDLAAAEQWFRKAIALSSSDLVSRLQLCDVLLQIREAQQVLNLLDGAPASEPVLLRRALAAQQLTDKSAARAALDAWQSAVDQSAQLGIRLHLRELARGELVLLNKPHQALATALQNWSVQRESADARILTDAARATKNLQALNQVREWQQALKFEDVQLTNL